MKTIGTFALVLALIFYLTGSFVEAGFNISLWRVEVREYIGWIYLSVLLLFAMFYGMDQSNKS